MNLDMLWFSFDLFYIPYSFLYLYKFSYSVNVFKVIMLWVYLYIDIAIYFNLQAGKDVYASYVILLPTMTPFVLIHH